jgi:hypothetical protein
MDTILDAVFMNNLRTSGGVYPPKCAQPGMCRVAGGSVLVSVGTCVCL